jgi:flavin-dependent dehydrogenase
MASPEYDVAVIGGGPAGSVAALTLARHGLRAALIEGSRYERVRIGETLPPAARPELERLGLADATLGARPAYGNQSAWGERELRANPFLFDPRGHGWHVDRRRFDAQLAAAAHAAGAILLQGDAVGACIAGEHGGWRLAVAGRELTANALIDAGGRGARIARGLGAQRQIEDHLVGVAAHYRSRDSGSTLVEAAADGWWYSAPLPDDRLVVMFMTDADLCRGLTDARAWAAHLDASVHTRARVAGAAALAAPRVSSAVTQRLRRGPDARAWLAAGDAALAVDPLSSSGILRALSSGEIAAEAIAHRLLGRMGAVDDYERWLDAQFADYLRERRAYYALETRWPDAAFWRRRTEAGLLRAA